VPPTAPTPEPLMAALATVLTLGPLTVVAAPATLPTPLLAPSVPATTPTLPRPTAALAITAPMRLEKGSHAMAATVQFAVFPWYAGTLLLSAFLIVGHACMGGMTCAYMYSASRGDLFVCEKVCLPCLLHAWLTICTTVLSLQHTHIHPFCVVQ
jgi:hypothetical protein